MRLPFTVDREKVVTIRDLIASPARSTGSGAAWEKRAREIAAQQGLCAVIRADDKLIVWTLKTGGKIARKTYKPDDWRYQR